MNARGETGGGVAMKTAIVANPVAGNGRGQRYAEALERALRHRGIEVALHVTREAGDGRRLASAVDAACVAVVGGDGTVNEVLNGLADRGACLAILAAGSANVVARELRFPARPERLAAWIAAGRTRRMDVFQCGGRRAMLGAGAGFDAAVTARVHESRGERLGLWRWVLPAVQIAHRYAAQPYPEIRATVDGREVCARSPYVIVGNCPFSAGRFRATPLAKTDDGLLDIVAVKRWGLWRMISLAAGSLLPGFARRGDLVYVQGRHVRLEPAGDVPALFQVDGDPAGTIPADIEALPRAGVLLARP